jgi:hypothetical protein
MLEGDKSDICRKSYNLFTDEDVAEFLSANTCENLQWYYHPGPYTGIFNWGGSGLSLGGMMRQFQ